MSEGTRPGATHPAREGVRVERAGDVTTLVLDRPSAANALDATTVDRLLDAVTRARHDGTRVLVLRGAGRHFCGGFDMKDVLQQSEGDLLLRFVRIEQLLQHLRCAPFVTVACVTGKAVGAGADLVAACAHRMVSPASTFRFPGFRFGVALGTRHLAELVGTRASREILLGSREVGADSALRIGLATRIVADGDFTAAVDEVISESASFDRESIAAVLARTARYGGDADGDMAALVASVARPGLHARLAAYLAG